MTTRSAEVNALRIIIKSSDRTAMKAEVAPPVSEMSPPWVAHYPPGVDWRMPLPVGTIPGLLDQATRRFPQNPAIGFLGRTTSYADLAGEVDRVVAAMHDLWRG